VSALAAEIRRIIAQEGPLGIDRYMTLCLGHPRHGYYMNRDPLGARGDFTTAPEISQMFGELIGLWAAHVWREMGAPSPVRLVELGPGRGTLMADALRAIGRAAPDFRAAVDLHFVETSPVLREAQAAAMAKADAHSMWHASLDAVPAGPALVIANEFFDALPVRQFQRVAGTWRERLVGLGPDDNLVFGLAGEPASGPLPLDAPDCTILEVSPDGVAHALSLARRLAGEGGAALIIDYGHVRSQFGETLQAVKGHSFADPVAEPGEADLTAHVDFAALAKAAQAAGAAVHGPVMQGDFLTALGIEARAAALAARADAAGQAAIAQALDRLAGRGEAQMGGLFKAMAIADPALPLLPGFDRRQSPGEASAHA
jgi:SAM-dependent MidA family methyltransferase